MRRSATRYYLVSNFRTKSMDGPVNAPPVPLDTTKRIQRLDKTVVNRIAAGEVSRIGLRPHDMGLISFPLPAGYSAPSECIKGVN